LSKGATAKNGCVCVFTTHFSCTNLDGLNAEDNFCVWVTNPITWLHRPTYFCTIFLQDLMMIPRVWDVHRCRAAHTQTVSCHQTLFLWKAWLLMIISYLLNHPTALQILKLTHTHRQHANIQSSGIFASKPHRGELLMNWTPHASW